MSKFWTDGKIAWLIKSKEIYDDREDILNAFNEHFKTNVSLHLLTKNNVRYKIGLPKAWKILRKNAEITQIKRRGFYKRPPNYEQKFYIGKRQFIKINGVQNNSKRKDGYIAKNRFMYEQYHNEILNPINDIIIHLDGDFTNYSKENLYKMKRSAHALMINHRLYNIKSIDKITLIKYCEWKEKINKMLERT